MTMTMMMVIMVTMTMMMVMSLTFVSGLFSDNDDKHGDDNGER